MGSVRTRGVGGARGRRAPRSLCAVAVLRGIFGVVSIFYAGGATGASPEATAPFEVEPKIEAAEERASTPRADSNAGSSGADSVALARGFEISAALHGAGGAHTRMPLDEVSACDAGSSSCRGAKDAGGRLRIEPVLHLDGGRVRAAVDLVCGDYYASRSEIPSSLRTREGFGLLEGCRGDVRRLELEQRTAIGLIRVGQTGSHFGLGMLANDGAGTQPFGESRSGDLVERIELTTSLAELGAAEGWADRTSISLAADLVRHDEAADLFANGERAMQGSAIATHRISSAQVLGLRLAYRHQDDAVGTGERVGVIDVHASWAWPLGEPLRLRTSAEAAWIRGTTTRVLSEQALDGLEVDAFGGIGRVALEGARGRSFRLEIESGFATGDTNPDDGSHRHFRFDPEYKVGLVLFDRALAGSTARSAARAADPARSSVPPLGTSELPTSGAIAGALYGAATLSYGLPFGLTLNFGGLLARATGDLIDPVASLASGGESVTLRGAPAASHHHLGTEIDIGVDHEIAWADGWRLTSSIQYGHLFPGAAFDAADGTRSPGMDAVFLRIALAATSFGR